MEPPSGSDDEFYEAAPLTDAHYADAAKGAPNDDASVYYDAADAPAGLWDGPAVTLPTVDLETATKVDELLLEELDEAWELETMSELHSVAGQSVLSRTSRRTRATLDPLEVELKLKEMKALRQALDFAMTNMLQRQAK